MTSESRKRLALGVDGGGTKSDAVLVDCSGSVLGWGRSGSAHSLYVGRETALESCAQAMRQALGEYRPDHLWISGIGRHAFERINPGISEVHFTDGRELTMGLAMALETHGLLVLSGTGAFVGGMTEDGKAVVLDGLGPMLGDYGSGYQIGLMGMRAAMASSWTSERRTSLAELVPKALKVVSTAELFSLVYTCNPGRSQIAGAARAVVEAAEDGDSVARKIITRAADDISEVLADVIRTLKVQESDCALIASGGIAQNSELYWDRVSELALSIAPNLRPARPTVRPCVGGALLALREMGIEWTPELLAHIEETHKPFLEALEIERGEPLSDKRGGFRLEYTEHGPQLTNDEGAVD